MSETVGHPEPELPSIERRLSAQLNERSADRSEISNANRSARFAACFNLNFVSVLGTLPLDAGVARRKCGLQKLGARATNCKRITPRVPARNRQSARYSADKGALSHYHRAALSIYRWCERKLRSRSTHSGA